MVLGLIVTLTPLIIFADIKAENHYDAMLYLQSLPEQMKKLERTYGLDTPAYSTADLQVLAISFTIALVVYVLFRHRIPFHDYRRAEL
jgi:hypothetical protein